QCQRQETIEKQRHEHRDNQRHDDVDRPTDKRNSPRGAPMARNGCEETFPFRGRPGGPPGFCCHALSLYPVRKMAQTAAKHTSRNTTTMEKLTTMLTSEMP